MIFEPLSIGAWALKTERRMNGNNKRGKMEAENMLSDRSAVLMKVRKSSYWKLRLFNNKDYLHPSCVLRTFSWLNRTTWALGKLAVMALFLFLPSSLSFTDCFLILKGVLLGHIHSPTSVPLFCTTLLNVSETTCFDFRCLATLLLVCQLFKYRS